MLLLLYHGTDTATPADPTIIIDSVKRLDDETFKIAFSIPATAIVPVTFVIYVDGVLVEQFLSDTGVGETVVRTPADSAPYVFITADPAELPPFAYPGNRTIVWTEIEESAVQFRIDEFISAAWVPVAFREATPARLYSYTTRYLEDSTTHQFRIVPLDSAGCEGTITTVDIYITRHPTPPSVSYAYDPGTGDLTITEN